MFDFDKNSQDFYSDYINKELFRSKFTLVSATNVNKLTFIDKINRSSYWFPIGSGRFSLEYDNKLRFKKNFSKNSTYNFNGFGFLVSFSLFIKSRYNNPVQDFNDPLFVTYVSLLNEVVRKQELKKNTQEVKMYSVNAWKYRHYSKYSSIKYYYNFEPHRNVARIKKFNFLAVYS